LPFVQDSINRDLGSNRDFFQLTHHEYSLALVGT
jgi:hypothetical protein